MSTYTVNVEWDETGWWVVTVVGVPGAVTQVKRLDQVPADAAEVIEIQTGQPPEDITIEYTLPDLLADDARRARELRAEADRLGTAAAEVAAQTVRKLRRTGLSQRDTGVLVGLSHQRVQQIESSEDDVSATG